MSSQDRTEALDPATLEKLAAAVPATLRSGFALGEYELVEEIGRGSMGLVFRAHHAGFGHDVALKVLPSSMALDAAARARFLTEARAMARVVHPNVVRVHNVVETEGTLAIAMERIEGMTLAALIRAIDSAGTPPTLDAVRRELGTGSHPWEATTYADWVAQIGAEIADALQAVHEAGLTHRDVKPSNILVDRHGHAHLADFGVVRDADATRTLAQGFVGTMAYASPEQLRGEGSIGRPADVFGLGATLYELLALEPPASGRLATVLETLEKGRIQPVGRKSAVQIPSQLGSVVHHSLQPEPDRRYSTASEFAADLRAVRGQRPISIRRPGLAERAVLWVQREPARASTAGALVAASTVLLAVGGYLLAQLPRIRMAREFEFSRRVDDLIGTGRILATLRATAETAEAPLREALALAPDNPIALGILAVHISSSSGPGAARALLAEHPRTIAASPALQRLEASGVEIYGSAPDDDALLATGNSDPLDCYFAGVAAAMRANEHNTEEDRRESMDGAIRLLEKAVLLSDPVPWIYRAELAGAAAAAGREALAIDQLRILESRRLGDAHSMSIALRAAMIFEALGRYEDALRRCESPAFQAATLTARVTLHARVLQKLGRQDDAIELLTLHAGADRSVLEALARAVEDTDPDRAKELFVVVADSVEAAIPAARARGLQVGLMLEAVHDSREKAGIEDEDYRERIERLVEEAPDDWNAQTILATLLAQRANRLYYSLWHHLPTFLAKYPETSAAQLSAMLARVPMRREVEQLRRRIGPLYEGLTRVVPFHPQVARNAALWSSFGTPEEVEIALDRFDRYAAVTPTPTAIPGGRGRLLYRAGRFEEAAAELERQNAFHDRVLFGWTLLETGEPRHALATFAAAEQRAEDMTSGSTLETTWLRNAALGRALATMRAGLRAADAAAIDEAEDLVRSVPDPDLFALDALVLAEAALMAGDRETAEKRLAIARRGRTLARELLPYGDQFGISVIAAHNTAFEALAEALHR